MHPRGVIAPQWRNGAHGVGKEVVLQLLLLALLGQCLLARFGLFAPCMQFVADVAQVLQGLGAWLAGHGSGVGSTGAVVGRHPLRVARIKELLLCLSVMSARTAAGLIVL